jgi:hypothetical protein
MNIQTASSLSKSFRFPPEIISHAVWWDGHPAPWPLARLGFDVPSPE